jgi:hypothetical protein
MPSSCASSTRSWGDRAGMHHGLRWGGGHRTKFRRFRRAEIQRLLPLRHRSRPRSPSLRALVGGGKKRSPGGGIPVRIGNIAVVTRRWLQRPTVRAMVAANARSWWLAAVRIWLDGTSDHETFKEIRNRLVSGLKHRNILNMRVGAGVDDFDVAQPIFSKTRCSRACWPCLFQRRSWGCLQARRLGDHP